MNLIGNKITLEYADQNEDYKEFLPRTAVIENKLASENVENWYLISLDKPFSYEGVNNEKLLIREKWVDVEIGSDKDVPVFIVQIPDESVIQGNNVTIIQDNLVAWGTVNVE